jgi:1-acyl-sn-glycerol-3-phosphate acyltransferase
MNPVKKILGTIWALWAIIWFIVTMVVFLLPFTVFYYQPEPRRTRYFISWARLWMRLFMPLVGCPVFVQGKENFKKGQNYIVLCNHNSLIDVPVSSPGIPGANKTIAKIEMAKIPVFGMLYRMGSVLVDRKSESSRRESFTKMQEVLDMGLHMCIYPEGTRNKTDQPLKTFHDGAFKLAIDSGKPIIPAIIFHSKKVMPVGSGLFLWPHFLEMHFLAPVTAQTGESSEKLKERVFTLMSNYYLAHSG